MIDDPALIVKALAFATGIVGRSGNPKSKIKSRLRDKKAVFVSIVVNTWLMSARLARGTLP